MSRPLLGVYHLRLKNEIKIPLLPLQVQGRTWVLSSLGLQESTLSRQEFTSKGSIPVKREPCYTSAYSRQPLTTSTPRKVLKVLAYIILLLEPTIYKAGVWALVSTTFPWGLLLLPTDLGFSCAPNCFGGFISPLEQLYYITLAVKNNVKQGKVFFHLGQTGWLVRFLLPQTRPIRYRYHFHNEDN